MDKQRSTRSISKKSGRDLSLEELFEMFPDERSAVEWFETNIWLYISSVRIQAYY